MPRQVKNALLKMDRPVPRYTSYPTSPHFKKLPPEHLYETWLRALKPDTPVSLYNHIPFCSALCWFCGCHTRVTGKYAPVASYLETMTEEARLVRDSIGFEPLVEHMHFGGGSPTIIQPDDFTNFIDALGKYFRINDKTEIAIEVDPRHTDAAKAGAYARARVSRISMGIQDFHPPTMQAINRVQSYEQCAAAMTLCRNAGISQFNVDLIYGLPLQTIATMQATLERIVDLSPDRISLFGYAHVPWLKKHMRLINEDDLPGASLRYDLFQHAADFLCANGFVQIGIDHFARQEDALAQSLQARALHRNFQGYTTDDNPVLLGLGASSIGRLPQGYIQNKVAIPDYKDSVSAGILPVERYHVMSDEDRVRGTIIETLMCYGQVQLSRFGRAPEDYPEALQQISELADQGLVKVEGDLIEATAPQAVRLVCAAFDAYLVAPDAAAPRHVRSV